MPGWKPLTEFCDSTSPTPFVEGVGGRCDFNALVVLVKNGVFDLVLLSTLFALGALVFSGIIWLNSRGSVTEHNRAIAMLGKVVTGYIWILAAWVIIYTIANALIKPEFNQILSL